MKIRANAKINMFLNVLGLRDDGYHDLDMIMQSVDFGDIVDITRSEKETAVDTADTFICEDPADNTAFMAARAFFDMTGLPGGATIRIEKRIPVMAGLGGGSADCAAVLYGLNELFERPMDVHGLMTLGTSIGADVPFAIEGGTRRARGIGEKLEETENNADCFYLISKPHAGVSTPAAFRALNFFPEDNPAHIEFCLAALRAGDIDGFRRHTLNSLETPARVLCPEMSEMLDYMRKYAEAAFMTGSGSAVVGMFSERESAEEMRERIGSAAVFSAVARAADRGLEMISEE